MKGVFGTVRYFGPLQVEKAGTDNWYGIEWDDLTKGKHNGTVEGVQYFVPQFHEPSDTCCSFIREGKLQFGISLKQAIEKKYQAYKDLTEEQRK